MGRKRAFTILELLVSLAVIALLASLIVVSWRGVRAGASRTESLNALRGLTRAYLTYATDHNQQLLPGYLDAGRFGAVFQWPTLPGGTDLDACDGMTDVCDASGYVWRLAPWIDESWNTVSAQRAAGEGQAITAPRTLWKTTFIDYSNTALTGQLEVEYLKQVYGPATARPAGPDSIINNQDDEIGAAMAPAFGLNAIFLGGDTVHGGANAVNRNPFDNPGGKLAATTMSEVINPSRVTVFGSSFNAASQDNADELSRSLWMKGELPGHPELRPPFLGFDAVANVRTDLQWTIDPSGEVQPDSGAVFAAGGGWPIGRWGDDEIPLSHLDGSVESVNRFELANDFAFWSPRATGIR